MSSSPSNDEPLTPGTPEEGRMFGLVLFLMEQSEMENTIFDCANSKKLYNIHYTTGNENYLK